MAKSKYTTYLDELEENLRINFCYPHIYSLDPQYSGGLYCYLKSESKTLAEVAETGVEPEPERATSFLKLLKAVSFPFTNED